MPSPVVIRAENVSKKYVISHLAKQQTIRDAMHHGLRLVWRRLRWQTKLNREEFWALKDVSFEVKRGEVLGIIGRNGAGKSTLLKILSRITEPTTGRISLNGRVASLLEVGTGFHPELTGRENIFLNGAILGMTRAEVRGKLDEIVAFAEIDRFIDTPVKRYSSGMYVRLAFAVAAHLEPEILIIDEVLAVGDISFQRKCLGRINKVSQSGRTILFVSHHLETIRQLCRNALLLKNGQIILHESAEKAIRTYLHVAPNATTIVEPTFEQHATGLHGITLTRVQLLNATGHGFTIKWRSPLQIDLLFTVTKPLAKVVFGLGIATLEGTGVLTVHSNDKSGEPTPLHPGAFRLIVTLANPLRQGHYKLIVGAHDASAKSSLLYVPDAIELTVEPDPDHPEPYIEHNSGLIDASSEWDIPSTHFHQNQSRPCLTV